MRKVHWMRAGTLLVAGIAALCAGCSNYTVALSAGPRINSYGLPEADQSGGRSLRMAVVALDNGAFDRLADSASLQGEINRNSDEPWRWITAERWFDEGLDQRVKEVLGKPGAMWTGVIAPGQTFDVKVQNPGPIGSKSGILVLADFTGMSKDNKYQFEPAIWKPTRWAGHDFRVIIGETTIKWAE